MKRKWKRFLSVLLTVVMALTMCPQIITKEASAAPETQSATMYNLGRLGSMKAGSKTKTGNWYKLVVNNKKAFCMNLGYTCHSGDTYTSAEDTYSSSGSGKNKLKAYVGYWYDQTQNQSDKAYVMAQALFWSIEEGDTSEDQLKATIKTVKTNTGYFSSKTVDSLYSEIFGVSGTVTVTVKKWTYAGSGSHRQELLQVEGNPIPEPLHTNATKRYRHRITIYKKDEDGNPLQGVQFTMTPKNIDELVSFMVCGDGDTINESVDADETNFVRTATTNANGILYYIFTYELQSREYYYYSAEELERMDDAAKIAAKAELDAQGRLYADDLSGSSASALAQADVESQVDQVSNSYEIKEDSTGNPHILPDPEWAVGKTVTLDKGYNIIKNQDGTWPDVSSGQFYDYTGCYGIDIQNNYKKISVKVNKKDDYSNDAKAHGDATLEGAMYRLYEDAACTTKATVQDDQGNKKKADDYEVKNGSFSTEWLRSGKTYYLKEIEAPEGYKLNPEVKTIVADGTAYSVEYTPDAQTIDAYESPILGKIQMFKVEDDNTSGGSSLGKWEAGAQFKIYLQSNGSYEGSDDYERDIITVNSEGVALSGDLYYGTYIVEQISTGGADTEMLAPFPVVIKEPDVVKTFVGIDPIFKAYLRIVKMDGNTEREVSKPGTSYQIYEVDKDTGEEKLVVQSTSDGNKVVTCDTWTTDESGFIITYRELKSGTYHIYETDSASGLHITTEYIEVEINSKLDNYRIEESADGTFRTIITTVYVNDETHGRLSIKKTGEQLADFVRTATTETGGVESISADIPFLPMGNGGFVSLVSGSFQYKTKDLKGVVFDIYAKEDIETQDGQGDLWFKKGEKVATVITGEGAEFTKECKKITKFSVDEDGLVTVDLPLGKYKVVEKQTLYGYVLPEKREWTVEFTWKNKDEPYVLDASGTTDKDGVLGVFNDRAKALLSIQKEDGKTLKPVKGAIFGLYSKHDIYNAEGNKIVNKDTLLTTMTTDENGQASPDIDLPLMSENYVAETASVESAVSEEPVRTDGEEDPNKGLNSGDYYFKELKISDSYYLDSQEVDVHLEYKDQDTKEIRVKVVKKNDQTEAEISKLTLAGSEELPGCSLKITDAAGKEIVSWISGDKNSIKLMENSDALGYRNLHAEMTEKGNLVIGGLQKGKQYTLTETRPADGYVTADSILFTLPQNRDSGITSSVIEGGLIHYTGQKIFMYDDTTKINISKTGITGEKEIEGCQLKVTRKADGSVIDQWTSGKEAHLIEGKLIAGETYTLTETRPADGYVTANSIDFTIQDTGQVQSVAMKDDTTKIRFRKIASDTKKLLPGAKYSVYDKSGKKVYSFTTNAKEPVMLNGILIAGETYTFKETKAPDNYEKAADVKIKVKDTGTVQKLKVVDKRKAGKIVTDTPDGFNEGDGMSPKTGYLFLMIVLALTMMGTGTGYVVLRRRKNGVEIQK